MRLTLNESARSIAHGSRAALFMLVAGLAGIAGGHALAQDRSPPARIVVVGEGTVTVSPDLALVHAGVTTNAKTVKEATETNSRTMASVITALTEGGIAQKDIQTSRFSVQPVYSPQQPNSDSKLAGYRVSNQVTAKIRHIDKLSDILERLTNAGATDVWNVEFVVSDPSKALDDARQAAVADARRKAELYARAASVSVGRIVSIEEGGVANPVLLNRAAAPTAAVPIAAGENTLRAVVTVGFDFGK